MARKIFYLLTYFVLVDSQGSNETLEKLGDFYLAWHCQSKVFLFEHCQLQIKMIFIDHDTVRYFCNIKTYISN